MKLLDSSGVCDLLGISKSTLYRWCGVSEEVSEGIGLPAKYLTAPNSRGTKGWAASMVNNLIEEKLAGFEETPKDFPRPFKIGRSYKWDNDEIESWVRGRRA